MCLSIFPQGKKKKRKKKRELPYLTAHGLGTTVHTFTVRQDRALAQLVHACFHFIDHLVVDLSRHDNAFDTNAVLTAVLKRTAHQDRDSLGQIRVLEENRAVFATQFEYTRHEIVRCVALDEFANTGGTDKGDMLDAALHDGLTDIGKASDELDEGGIVTMSFETFADDFLVVLRRPGNIFGGLDKDGVTGHQGRDDRTQHVVETGKPIDGMSFCLLCFH